MNLREQVNAFRYAGDQAGHYESYFQRANHATRPLAFWVRYTIYSPKGRAEAAVGELWAVYFDGEKGEISAAKQVVPLAECEFAKRGLQARIGSAVLLQDGLSGAAHGPRHHLSWQLSYVSPEEPLLLFPSRLYETKLPRAKALVGSPQAVFHGEIVVNGQVQTIDGWVGSQNHNWGSRHTDRYAWGQVAGFDGVPEAFLECATARVRVGPFLTPPMSPLVLRLGSEELRFSTLRQALAATGSYEPFRWQLRSASPGAEIEVEIEAKAADFVALPYDNPPGGQKICLNSKLAACRVRLTRRGKPALVLQTQHRAAFEILGDLSVPGVATL
jgi:hypothetical protein